MLALRSCPEALHVFTVNTHSCNCRESADNTVSALRDKAMQLFFRRLTSHDEELVDAARSGLAAVVAHQRMPKTLLQVVFFTLPLLYHEINQQMREPCSGLAAVVCLPAHAQDAAAGDNVTPECSPLFHSLAAVVIHWWQQRL